MSPESELFANGCLSPEWFLRDHIPRYAEHFGVTQRVAYQSVLGEIAALKQVRDENNRQMAETGLVHKMFQIYEKRGQLANVGERPLIVIDNYTYMMRTEYSGNYKEGTYSEDTTYYDPLKPLAIGNFHTMDDPIPSQCVNPITIGRPNSDDELWLADGITVEDYEVVKDCFARLLSLRTGGAAPHMRATMDHVSIPYTLSRAENPYDPNEFDHGPVEYSGFASELKVAS